MTNLLKDKFKKVTWIIDCHASFDALKKALREALVLRIMDPLKGRLLLCTDASNMAIGTIMMQDGKVIAYESKKLSNAKLNYPVHDYKKILAIIHALKVWRHYLFNSEFKIETDYQSFRYFTSQFIMNHRQSRWMKLMQEFNFEM